MLSGRARQSRDDVFGAPNWLEKRYKGPGRVGEGWGTNGRIACAYLCVSTAKIEKGPKYGSTKQIREQEQEQAFA